MSAKSTKARRSNKSQKPSKPYPDFPLFPHASGRWAKKIRGRLHYLGRWGHKSGSRIVPVDNPTAAAQAAVAEYNRQRDDLHAGRTPPPAEVGDACTLRVLCNAFLTSKENSMKAGELSPRTFHEYFRVCERMVDHFGRDRRVDDLRPNDFEGFRVKLAERYGVVGLRNTINACRVVFKYAFDQELVDRPVRYGQSFDRPSAKALRKSRNEAGQRMFEPDELRRILDAADPILKAMTLLGVNCGFGNTDIASLPQKAVDLAGGWIDFPRPKTEIQRRVPLWPETVEALHAAIAARPEAAESSDADLCFLTSKGNRWVRMQESKKRPGELIPLDALSQRFAKLLKRLAINGRRGLGFYTLRHVFQTVGGESKDPDAVSSIMGHVDSSMAGVYRERISDERLQAAVDVVRAWLSSAS